MTTRINMKTTPIGSAADVLIERHSEQWKAAIHDAERRCAKNAGNEKAKVYWSQVAQNIREKWIAQQHETKERHVAEHLATFHEQFVKQLQRSISRGTKASIRMSQELALDLRRAQSCLEWCESEWSDIAAGALAQTMLEHYPDLHDAEQWQRVTQGMASMPDNPFEERGNPHVLLAAVLVQKYLIHPMVADRWDENSTSASARMNDRANRRASKNLLRELSPLFVYTDAEKYMMGMT